jgi:Ca-activated chloride channel homolog
MRQELRIAVVGCAVLLGTSGFDLLWSHNRNVTRGNELLAAGKAKEALEQFDLALKRLPDDPGVRFNRALALAELNQLDEAQKDLLRASESHDAGLKARAHFNLGNALARQEKWKEAVEAYTRALTVDPKYYDAKWNLELARRKLKEQEEKKKQEEQKKKEEEKKQQEEQKKKEEEEKQQQEQNQNQAGQDGGAPQPKPEQQDDKKRQEQEQKQQEEQKQRQQEQEQKQKEQSKPEAGKEQQQPKPEPRAGEPDKQPQGTPRPAVDAVLDALEKNEKNLPLERLRARSRRRPDKDW